MVKEVLYKYAMPIDEITSLPYISLLDQREWSAWGSGVETDALQSIYLKSKEDAAQLKKPLTSKEILASIKVPSRKRDSCPVGRKFRRFI